MMKLSKSSLSKREQGSVLRVLESEFLGMGKEVKNFEEELSNYLDSSLVVCVNTGTSALQLALEAVGIGPGDEVLVPTITYVASYQAISATGATPISCDVSIDTCLIDLVDAQKRITENTKAIMPVHYASYPGNLDDMYQFAKVNKLRVIEDAAQAFGCSYNGEKIGSIGDVICFSFDGIKNITSGEGGAVVSRDQKVIDFVKDARLLGVEKDSDARFLSQRSWEFDVKVQGWRYHMSDIMAAIGRVQLARFESEFKPKRKLLVAHYVKRLNDVEGIALFKTNMDEVVQHIMPVRVLINKRNAVRSALMKHGIQSGIHYKPNHLLTKYNRQEHLPVAEKLYNELLTLPLHVDLSLAEIDQIVEVLQSVLSEKCFID